MRRFLEVAATRRAQLAARHLLAEYHDARAMARITIADGTPRHDDKCSWPQPAQLQARARRLSDGGAGGAARDRRARTPSATNACHARHRRHARASFPPLRERLRSRKRFARAVTR